MSTHEKAKICQKCTHFRAAGDEITFGRCCAHAPLGELAAPITLSSPAKFYRFPQVFTNDGCSEFNPRPCVYEGGSIKECTDRIADALHRWHSLKGFDAPMPGWLFNRKLKGFPADVVTLAKDRLMKQGWLACVPYGGGKGRRGFFYHLKIKDENN